MSNVIAMNGLSMSERYALLTQIVVPRPIAWVLTRNQNGTLNLAPFSYFNVVSSEPAIVMVSIGHKDLPESKNALKDTASNLLRDRQCVIHIAPFSAMDQVQKTAAELSHEESEATQFGISVIEQECFSLPRVEMAPVAMNGRYYEHHILGSDKQHVFYIEIESIHVQPGYTENGQGRLFIDCGKLDPLARIGAGYYAGINRISKPHSLP